MAENQSKSPEKRERGNPNWRPGVSGNPGGRKRTLVEIERMLDAEHRNVEGMRKVFARLKGLALDDVPKILLDKEGGEHETLIPPDPAFMKLYLERVLGPVKDLEPDLSDAPAEVIDYLRNLQ